MQWKEELDLSGPFWTDQSATSFTLILPTVLSSIAVGDFYAE
jgi:hypothetical protein